MGENLRTNSASRIHPEENEPPHPEEDEIHPSGPCHLNLDGKQALAEERQRDPKPNTLATIERLESLSHCRLQGDRRLHCFVLRSLNCTKFLQLWRPSPE